MTQSRGPLRDTISISWGVGRRRANQGFETASACQRRTRLADGGEFRPRGRYHGAAACSGGDLELERALYRWPCRLRLGSRSVHRLHLRRQGSCLRNHLVRNQLQRLGLGLPRRRQLAKRRLGRRTGNRPLGHEHQGVIVGFGVLVDGGDPFSCRHYADRQIRPARVGSCPARVSGVARRAALRHRRPRLDPVRREIGPDDLFRDRRQYVQPFILGLGAKLALRRRCGCGC